MGIVAEFTAAEAAELTFEGAMRTVADTVTFEVFDSLYIASRRASSGRHARR